MTMRLRTLAWAVALVALCIPACTKTYTEADVRRIEHEQAEKDRETLDSARRTEELGGLSSEGLHDAMLEAEIENER